MEAGMKRAVKIILWLGVPVACLLAVWGIGFARYEKTFLPKTYLNKINVSGMTAEEVKDTLNEKVREYTLTVKEREGQEETISANAMGISYKDTGEVDRALASQDRKMWFYEAAKTRSVRVSDDFTFSEEMTRKAAGALKALDPAAMKDPENASIEKGTESFSIREGADGTRLDIGKAEDVIISAVREKKTSVDLEEEGLYTSPEIKSDNPDLVARVDALNKMVNAQVRYDLGDSRIYTTTPAKIMEWLVQGSDGNYSLDRASVKKWVDKMAYDTDTFGLRRSFTTHDGRTIELAGGGDYGWAMNEEKTTEDLISRISSGTSGDATPIYLYSARSRSKNDIGGTYAEVCIGEQMMYVYKDGQLAVQTPVVTGNESRGLSTPSGSCWAIDAKKPNAAFSQNPVTVSYWLPFNGGCGLHDASWRSEFGGNIYKTNGSHGCVNTPPDAMAQVFSVLEIGDPVIVYYTADQPVGPQPTGTVTAG